MIAHAGRQVPVDVFAVPGRPRPPGLVLVHGLAPRGKDDPRLREAAALLARLGWDVAVPTVDGLTRFRLRPEDADAVSAAVIALVSERYRAVAVLGVSVGAGPALLAPERLRRVLAPSPVRAVLAIGGYASAPELLRYALTGAFAFEDVQGRRPPDDDAIRQFAVANPELMGGAGAALVANRDPARFDALLAALDPGTRGLLERLSPEGRLRALRARLFLVHGRGDPAVPFTETLRLAHAARAAGQPVRAAVVGAIAHVEGERAFGALDLARMWATVHAFRSSTR